MKKIALLLLPLVIAGFVFAGYVFFISRKTGGKGAIQVTSTPQSTVYLNGVMLGKTPLCKCEGSDMLASGEYTIRLVPDGSFVPFEEKITIIPSVLTVVDRTFANEGASSGSIITLLPLTSTAKNELMVLSFPDKAHVSLDENDQGITPTLLKDITESDHEVLLTKDGYLDKSVRVRSVNGYRLLMTVYLGVNPDLTASVSATPTPSSSPSATPQQHIVILDTPTGFLRVRQDATITSNEIGRVNPGDTYSLLSEQDGWYEIDLGNGKSGWVSAQYAKKQ